MFFGVHRYKELVEKRGTSGNRRGVCPSDTRPLYTVSVSFIDNSPHPLQAYNCYIEGTSIPPGRTELIENGVDKILGRSDRTLKFERLGQDAPGWLGDTASRANVCTSATSGLALLACKQVVATSQPLEALILELESLKLRP